MEHLQTPVVPIAISIIVPRSGSYPRVFKMEMVYESIT
jgi:hypothetical protein